jgi:hypothetical protein
MSRKDRKIASIKRKQYQHEAWLNELQSHVASGKTYKESCEIMARETLITITRNPQEKSQIMQAWKEFFEIVKRHAAEVINEMNKTNKNQ